MAQLPESFGKAATQEFYKTVIKEVIKDASEVFLDEGVDEQVLEDLQQLWEEKLIAYSAPQYKTGTIHEQSLTPENSVYVDGEEDILAQPSEKRFKACPQTPQMDGEHLSSDSEDSSENINSEDGRNENQENTSEDSANESLNSRDDIPDELEIDTDNIIVCKYHKINRCQERWTLLLKNGIMNLNGEDYVFEKAIGTTKW